MSPTRERSVSSMQTNPWDEKSIDGLGYLKNNDDNLLGYLKTVGFANVLALLDP